MMMMIMIWWWWWWSFYSFSSFLPSIYPSTDLSVFYHLSVECIYLIHKQVPYSLHSSQSIYDIFTTITPPSLSSPYVVRPNTWYKVRERRKVQARMQDGMQPLLWILYVILLWCRSGVNCLIRQVAVMCSRGWLCNIAYVLASMFHSLSNTRILSHCPWKLFPISRIYRFNRDNTRYVTRKRGLVGHGLSASLAPTNSVGLQEQRSSYRRITPTPTPDPDRRRTNE